MGLEKLALSCLDSGDAERARTIMQACAPHVPCTVMSRFYRTSRYTRSQLDGAQDSSVCIKLPIQHLLNFSKSGLTEVHCAGTNHFDKRNLTVHCKAPLLQS